MTYELDQIDRQILIELLQNGRARYVEMSKSMGVGSSTVRWRIKRLEEDGVIFGYTCLPNIEYFKLYPAIFFIRISHDMEKVVVQLKKFGKLTSIVITFGDSNIVCRGAFENIDDLLALKDDISTVEGISEVQTCITHKGIGMGGEIPLELIQRTKRLDVVDRQLLEELIKDARVSYTELGKKLNMNASTVRLRIMQLIDKGIIRKFTARLDLTKLGQLPAFLRIKTKGGKTSEVIQKLTEIQDVVMAVPCIGECDIFGRIIVKDTEELNRLLNEIVNIESVRDVKADYTVKGEKIGGFLPPKMLRNLFQPTHP
ncbi:MAG: Lrp/AsnC family transcriptional regulator [Euryarchaeota archaeon]|nr:Lrp/AsnC family transcriptional regulator [Euryarchaeota archaeon]